MNLILEIYNSMIGAVRKNSATPSGWRELDEIKQHSLKRTDISDHLVTLFVEAMSIRPKLIVELGVRGGESTFVFERVAKLCESTLVSVDIDECSGASSYEGWIFEKADDITFSKSFGQWCERHGIDPQIDILFIDTSHLFQHTVEEIECWFPFLSEKSKVFFHDTNGRRIFFRKDGSVGTGFNNRRAVIGALERFLEKSFNERQPFVDWAKGWLIRHHSNCAGLTILERSQAGYLAEVESERMYTSRIV